MDRHLITDGETIEITKSCPYIVHECCKCGLRHKWEFIWKKRGVDVKITEEPSGDFLESLSNFLADPTGLSQREIIEELEEQGIDVNRLKDRVKDVIKKGLKKRDVGL